MGNGLGKPEGRGRKKDQSEGKRKSRWLPPLLGRGKNDACANEIREEGKFGTAEKFFMQEEKDLHMKSSKRKWGKKLTQCLLNQCFEKEYMWGSRAGEQKKGGHPSLQGSPS